MGTVNYRNAITAFIDRQEPDTPITTQMIVDHVVFQTGIDDDDVRKAVNVNMGRIEKQGLVRRVTRGVYCKQVKTAFGAYSAGNETLFCKLLTRDGDKVIGYETGASAFNRMGLTTQMPQRICIATNAYTRLQPEGVDVEVRKPVTEVTKANCRYLQLLDIINDIDRYPVDAPSPAEIIRGLVRDYNLDINKLLVYCRKFYHEGLLGKTVDIVLGGTTI
ncbi:MAG: DUF6088 family protein [Lachnospiraceae bacterium]|nr:DUF6088 family protein [Lachnospiraceae bacterium]